MSPTYEYEQVIIKTGESTDHGNGWCAVIEKENIHDLLGVDIPFTSEEAVLIAVAKKLFSTVDELKETKISDVPEAISLDAEYLM